MTVWRPLLCVVAAAAALAATHAAAWQAQTEIRAVADPQAGVLLGWRRLGESEAAGAALFEIARDGRFSRVEVSYLPEDAIAPEVELPGPQSRTAALAPSDDYAACARAAAQGPWSPPEILAPGETRLFRPVRLGAGSELDAHLARGSCVL